MNITIVTLMLTGLLSASPLYVQAAEKTTEDATIPPSALPGLNQPESNEEKADKKGEEAAGSNAGADAHSREFSEEAFRLAGEPKELVIVPNAGHVDLYDRVDVEVVMNDPASISRVDTPLWDALAVALMAAAAVLFIFYALWFKEQNYVREEEATA